MRKLAASWSILMATMSVLHSVGAFAQEAPPPPSQPPAQPAAPGPKPTPTPTPTPAPSLARVDPDLELDLNLNRIVVDLKQGGLLQPREPVVNMATGDVVTVTVVTDEPEENVSAEVSMLGETAALVGRKRFVLNFRQCDAGGARSYWMARGITTRRELAAKVEEKGTPCPAVVQIPAGFLVLAHKDKDRGWASVTVRDCKTSRMFPVRVVVRHWNVGFSTGLVGFPARTNERYYLGEAKDQKAPILKAKESELSYRVATLATYEYSGLKGAGFSLGLATGVPSTDLALLAGATFSLRTLPIARSARVTAGWASVTFDRLKPKYSGLFGSSTPIAAATDPADLIEKRRVNAFFVAVTFGFWDSESKFKTLLEGAK